MAKLIRREELTAGTVQTSGMARAQAFRTPMVWAGRTLTSPGAISGWHHHGEHESVIYIVRGAMRLEAGPGGREIHEATAGDFMYVAPGEVHRESNPEADQSELVVFRSGSGETVVNVDGPTD